MCFYIMVDWMCCLSSVCFVAEALFERQERKEQVEEVCSGRNALHQETQ